MCTLFRGLYHFALFVHKLIQSSTHAADPGMDWEYFSLSGHTRPELLAYPDGTFELTMTVRINDVFSSSSKKEIDPRMLQKHALHIPNVLNLKIAGVDAYQTNDLIVPHPTRAGLWKIFGRVDDQIMLSTGEKVCWTTCSLHLRHLTRPTDQPRSSG